MTTLHAAGTFEVELSPLEPSGEAAGATFGRMAIDKRYAGDLVAAGEGQMLSVTTAVEGSAAYVALERVTGTLGGREGSFALVHRGLMSGGSKDLDLQVVPDSGTSELSGLTGKMGIEIVDGRHEYRFEYSLPEV